MPPVHRKSARILALPVKSYSLLRRPASAKNSTVTRSFEKSTFTRKAPKRSGKVLTKLETHKTGETVVSNARGDGPLLRKYDVLKAWSHVKSMDPGLASAMDEKAFTEFQQRIELADGSNPFKALVTSIIYQQIHGKAAASIRNKFIRLFDSPVPFPDETVILPSSFPWFPTPDMILNKSVEELRSAGLSQRKTEYILDLCSKFLDKSIIGEELDKMSDEDISKLLCSVKGIGQWTVDMLLMFNLCHPDVLPVTDLGVRRGVALHFNNGKEKIKRDKVILPSPQEMRELTNIWSPYRTVGSWLMWRIQEIKTVIDD